MTLLFWRCDSLLSGWRSKNRKNYKNGCTSLYHFIVGSKVWGRARCPITRGYCLPLKENAAGERGRKGNQKEGTCQLTGRRWRKGERVKTWCQVSLSLPSSLVIYWKDSQDPEKLLYSWLWLITAKGHRMKSALMSAREKGTSGGFWRRAGNRASSRPLLGVSHKQHSILPAMMYENTYELSPTSLHIQSFYWGSASHIGMEHPHDWPWLLSPQSPQRSNWYRTSEIQKRGIYHKSHSRHKLSVMAHGPRYTKTLLSGRILQGLGVDLLEAVKDHSFL